MQALTPEKIASFERRRAAIVARMNELDEHLMASIDLDTGFLFGERFGSDDIATTMLRLHEMLTFCATFIADLDSDEIQKLALVWSELEHRGETLQ